MRNWLIAIAAAVATMTGLNGSPAMAREENRDDCRLVRSFYAQYLHRDADAVGLRNWMEGLRCGMSPIDVECAIMASDEYYHLHGCTPEGFARGLYEDILGREPGRQEACNWGRDLARCGDRARGAFSFINAAQPEIANRALPPAPPVYAPAPVYVAPSPVYVHPRHHDDEDNHIAVRIRLGR